MYLKTNILMAFVGAAMFTSCADNDPLDFQVTKPEKLSQYEYLNGYDVLKNYVDAEANPNFILGSAVNAEEYNKKGVVYALTNTNFQDVVTVNAFKYASCVDENGQMNFTTVKDFVKNATSAGLSVFGHTLAWHSQQNNKYLNKIIAGRVDPTAPPVFVDKEDKVCDYSQMDHFPWYVMGYTPKFEDGCMVSENPGSWYQYFAEDNIPTDKGATYYIDVVIKGSEPGSFNVNIGDWGGSASAQLAYGTEFKTVTLKMNEVPASKSFVIFQPGNQAGKIWIKSLRVYHKVSSNFITLTPEEQKDTLIWAMDKWIGGIMSACAGRVKAWDVVNEPISGVDKDGDGFYDLQSATRETVGAKDAEANFYWQDYLGDLDYVRTAVALARKNFAATGGNAADLKLFVNDYNLEATWDNNKKCSSLVDWIKKWEADGKTKIDGIGTQMHVSVNMNAAAQKKQEECVAKMFEIMAASGKLVRISELDMGIVDEEGNEVKTVDATEEQLKAQAKYFNYIVRTYFEKVPAAQRYSICAWGQTDSPAGSGWRAGMPIGIWDANYNRKHAYAGFADGLAGKEYTAGE
jgi:GH35 family endo-1,4-beta-xylanase